MFSIKLNRTGDARFTGPWGYRAQYWLSPARGLSANGELIAALTAKLIAALSSADVKRLEGIDLNKSLRAASAKVWVVEGSPYNDPPHDLAIDRWVRAANDGNGAARKALYAPDDGKFEVKGALIDRDGHDVVPSRKVLRHYDIHFGFS